MEVYQMWVTQAPTGIKVFSGKPKVQSLWQNGTLCQSVLDLKETTGWQQDGCQHPDQ